MKTILAVLVITCTALWAADKFQPLNVKTGTWETTRTITTSGAMPLPAEMLSTLTPEQRARMEERMKARSGERTRTSTEKSCVTKEDLQKTPSFGQNECALTVLESTSSKADLKMVCDVQGMKGSGTMHIVASNTETIQGSGETTVSGNGNTMHVKSNFTSKWIGASCEKK